MLSSTGTPLTEGSLLTSSALVTVALLALVALLYFLDQRCIATGRPISTLGPFLCTANVVQRSLADWKANVISTFPNQKRFSVRSQNKLGQSVSSVYSLPGKCQVFLFGNFQQLHHFLHYTMYKVQTLRSNSATL